MKTTGLITRKRLLPVAIVLPVAGAVLLGGAGFAYASTTGATNGSDTPSYHSSITTKATGESGNEAAADLALTEAAKIDLAQAARAGAAAVPGGSPTSVELTNEGGNVIYTVTVVTSKKETDVIIDAGNAKVLATQVDQEKGGSDKASDEGASSNAPAPATSLPSSQGGASGTTGP